MKLIFDYFPVVCFFVAYKLFGIYIATATTIAASLLQVALYWLIYRRFERLHLITFALITALGGSTLLFHNEMFIKWKPSIIYWIFSGTLLFTQLFNDKPLVAKMLAGKIALPDPVYSRLNWLWTLFFGGLGSLNLYIAYHYDTNTWVNFKLFGTMALLFTFFAIQIIYLYKHLNKEQSAI